MGPFFSILSREPSAALFKEVTSTKDTSRLSPSQPNSKVIEQFFRFWYWENQRNLPCRIYRQCQPHKDRLESRSGYWFFTNGVIRQHHRHAEPPCIAEQWHQPFAAVCSRNACGYPPTGWSTPYRVLWYGYSSKKDPRDSSEHTA